MRAGEGLRADKVDCAPAPVRSTFAPYSLDVFGEAIIEGQFLTFWNRTPAYAEDVTIPDNGRDVLDVDTTDLPLHGKQEGRFFHGYYDNYCYLPLYVFCGDHVLCAHGCGKPVTMLRSAV